MDKTLTTSNEDRTTATMRDNEIASLAREALDAFWQVIARHYPQARSGDLSIRRTIALQIAAENALVEWITNNVPIQPEDQCARQTEQPDLVKVGYRFKLGGAVGRFPNFMAPAGLTGTVKIVDENGLWAKMDQHIAGAEEWKNEIYWPTVEEFLGDSEPCL
jgi:hypothetical protein